MGEAAVETGAVVAETGAAVALTDETNPSVLDDRAVEVR